MLTLPLALALTLHASYEMADLKALEKQGGFKELVAHLNDIPPSKRDKEWEGIAERAAAGWLGTIDVKDEYSAQEALGVADEVLTHYTFLKQSKVYMGKRAEVALKAFKFTFGQSRHSAGDDPWRDEVKKFAESDTLTPDLPARLAKELIIGRLIPSTTFPLFKMAWDRGNKGLCKDKDFQKMLVEVLGEGEWRDASGELKDKCWDDIKAPLTASVKKEGTSKVARNVCPIFTAKGGVPADAKAACDGLIQ